MDKLKKLIDAFNELGEAASVYKNQQFTVVNDLFAEIFEREVDAFEGLPIIEVCHNESIEMIRDFMHRRAVENHGVPMNYKCTFRTPNQPKLMLDVIAIRLRDADDGVLIIVRKA
jgi:PAS domain-containing protein